MLDFDQQIKYINLCAKRNALEDCLKDIYRNKFYTYRSNCIIDMNSMFDKDIEALSRELKGVLTELRLLDQINFGRKLEEIREEEK